MSVKTSLRPSRVLTLLVGVALVVTPLTMIDAAYAVGDSSVSGFVAGPGGTPATGICVSAESVNSGGYASNTTGSTGAYTLTGLPAGPVKIDFYDCGAGNLVSEWYDNKPSYSAATPVTLAAASNTTINAELAAAGHVIGTVSTTAGPAKDVCVEAYNTDDDYLGSDTTLANGTYDLGGLPPGTVKLRFDDCGSGNLIPEWYQDQTSFSTATPVSVTAGQSSPANAVLAIGGSVAGQLTTPAGTNTDDLCVSAYSGPDVVAGSTYVNSDGTYEVTGLPAGTVKMYFYSCGNGANVLGEWYADKATYAAAAPVTVTSTQTTSNINAVLATGGQVTGTVSKVGAGAIGDVCVEVDQAASENDYVDSTRTGSDGTYTFVGLPTGSYKLHFQDCGSNGVLPEYYNDKATFAAADAVPVTAGATPAVANAQLAPSAVITGKVIGPGGGGLGGICVDAYSATDQQIYLGYGETEADGTYVITGLQSGQVKLDFYACEGDNYVREYYNNKTSFSAADTLTLTAGQTTANINAELAAGGSLSGTVTVPAGATVQDVCVDVFDLANNYLSGGYPAVNGAYTVIGLPAGSVKVDFYDCGSGVALLEEWYNDKPDFASANTVAVTTGGTTPNINATLAADTTAGAAPDTQITGGPLSGSTQATASATFTFTATGNATGFQCSVDAAAFTACTSPLTLNGLANGSHTFSVRARTATGVVDPSPATRSFMVNVGTTPPPVPTPTPNPAPTPAPGPSAACTAATAALSTATAGVTAAQAKVASATKKYKKVKKSGASAAKKKAAKKKVAKAKTALKTAQAAVSTAAAAKNAAC